MKTFLLVGLKIKVLSKMSWMHSLVSVNIITIIIIVNYHYYKYHFSENEIDGDAFLLLNKSQFKQLVPALGPQAKLIQKHRDIVTVQEV